MTHETPEQRRTRLIEQYAGQLYSKLHHSCASQVADSALMLADAVIAATPQEPAQPTRYPSETETRLIELVEYCTQCISDSYNINRILGMLAAIKRELGLDP